MVNFEDLDLLDRVDLRAVLRQLPKELVCEALAGSSVSFRTMLLSRLGDREAAEFHKEIAAAAPADISRVIAARQAVVEAIKRLGNTGVIAFDDPGDMMDEDLVA